MKVTHMRLKATLRSHLRNDSRSKPMMTSHQDTQINFVSLQ